MLILANEATASKRRVYFQVVDVTDGMTPETGEAAGQPQVSSDGGAWTNTGIGTLNSIGNGRYYADLTQTLVATAGTNIQTRYKSANTAEAPGDSVQVISLDLTTDIAQTGNSFTRLGAPAGASVSADIAAVKADSAAIKAKTDNLPADPADASDIAASFATVNSNIAGVQSDTDNIQTRLPAALVSGRMDSSVGAMAADTLTSSALATSAVDEIVDQVWDEVLAGHQTAGTTGKALSDAGAVSADPWLTALPGAYGAGTAGKIVGDNIDALISSRMATYTQPTGFLAATFPGGTVANTTNITAGTITTATNLTTNNDKTGYGLSSAAVQAIWDALTTALTTAGSIGKKLADWVIGTTQTGDSFARLGAPVGASISADIAAVQADTDNIQTRIPAALVGGRIDASVGAMAADTITASALATSAVDEIVDGVWDEALAGHMTAGTTGKTLSDAGAVGADPWLMALPGAYAAGSAGYIVGTNLDATTSSRASAAALATVQADTDDIQTRLPATLDGGLMRSQVKGMDTDTVNAAAVAASAVTEIQSGLATSAALSTAQSAITAIKAVTDVLPNAGTLSTIQSDLDDIQSRLPASLVGGKMDSNLGSITVGVDLSATMKASINAEVVDVINTDTGTELSAVPSATAPLRQQIQFSYQAIRNKNTTSTTQNKLHKDDGTVFATAPVADSGLLFTKDEYV